MDLSKLKTLLENEPSFRVKQAKQAIFRDLISDWREAKWLPQNLRQQLAKDFPLKINAQDFISKDRNTIKTLITLDDGLKIETVLMKHQGRNTVCLSSQVGCPLGCLFCATGKMGFKRNLTDWEIVSQVVNFGRILKQNSPSRSRFALYQTVQGFAPPGRCPNGLLPGEDREKVTNVVLMGMGEPFLNYDHVMEAIRIINDPEGLGIGARHISISTVGIIEGIKRLAKEPLQVNLAISLHAANNELRSRLIPINNRYSIEKIMDAVGDYIKRTNRKVMFEYLMIDKMNDSKDNALELAGLIKKFKKPLVMVNLIKYNPVPVGTGLRPTPDSAGYNLTGNFQPSNNKTIQQFKNILIKEGVFVTERYRFGSDIHGACGQLTA